MCSRPLHGFTLVELLVVIAILGTLVGLVLPAVQASRENARLTACRNNLSQLSKALLRHEAEFGSFPSGSWGPHWLGVAGRAADSAQPGGWIFDILPLIEEDNTRRIVESTVGNCGPAYAKLAAHPMPVFACPSRRSARLLPLTGDGQGATRETAAR